MIMQKKTNFQEVSDRVEAARLLQEGSQQDASNETLHQLARDILNEIPHDGKEERAVRRAIGESEETIKETMGDRY